MMIKIMFRNIKKFLGNNNNKTKNLRKKFMPIIKKYNKQYIKIDKNYIFKENLSESEILSECYTLVDSNNI